MKISVIGCGYVGLVTGAGLASAGHTVRVVDIDPGKVTTINTGQPPFYEPDLPEVLQKVVSGGTLSATVDVNEAVRDSDVVFVCVGTPSRPNGSIDTKALETATHQVAECMRDSKRYQVLAIRSTVVPGTTSGLVVPLMQEVMKGHQVWYDVAVNPEFLQEGTAVKDFFSPDRVVLGVTDQRAAETLKAVYAPFNAPVVVATTTEAEMIKYTSNTLLATLVSFSNEISQICEALPGVDADLVMNAIHLDRRFYSSEGKKSPAGIVSYLRPGCGFGGSCLPKDLRALLARSEELGVPTPLLSSVKDINEAQPIHVVDLVENALLDLAGKRIVVLGLAFKGGTADLRESPALTIVEELLRRGARVTAFDPLVQADAAPELTKLLIELAPDINSALAGAEAIIITTNAPEFTNLSPDSLVMNGKKPLVVDGRRVLNPEAFSQSDAIYLAVGRRNIEVM